MSNLMVLSQAKKLAENLSIEGDANELVDTLKATAFKVKDGVVTDAQLAALMIVSQQYNLNPWTKQIYAYPDKQNGIVPVVGIDGWVAIIERHPQYDGVEFKYSDDIITPDGGKPCPTYIDCMIYRKDRTRPTVIREYLDEVYKKPNFPSPWQTHTKRFLRHKSLIQCARVAFGFGGIYEPDEADNIVDAGERVINPIPNQPASLTLDQILAKVGVMAEAELTPDQLAGLDLKPFGKEDILSIKGAITARRKELRASAVVADIKPEPGKVADNTDWADLIENSQSKEELESIAKSIPANEAAKYQDAINEQLDFLRGLL